MLAKAAKIAPATSTSSRAAQKAVCQEAEVGKSLAVPGMGVSATLQRSCQVSQQEVTVADRPRTQQSSSVDSSVIEFIKISLSFENTNCQYFHDYYNYWHETDEFASLPGFLGTRAEPLPAGCASCGFRPAGISSSRTTTIPEPRARRAPRPFCPSLTSNSPINSSLTNNPTRRPQAPGCAPVRHPPRSRCGSTRRCPQPLAPQPSLSRLPLFTCPPHRPPCQQPMRSRVFMPSLSHTRWRSSSPHRRLTLGASGPPRPSRTRIVSRTSASPLWKGGRPALSMSRRHPAGKAPVTSCAGRVLVGHRRALRRQRKRD